MNADRHLVLAIVAAAGGDAAALDAHRGRARDAVAQAPDVAERVETRLAGLVLADPNTPAGLEWAAQALEFVDKG